MNCVRKVVIFAVAIGAVCSSALAQDAAPKPEHVPLQKVIGQPKSQVVVPSLIVLNSSGATLTDGKLVLTGVAPNSIIFADRPIRSAGHDLTAHIIEDWAKGHDNFAENPPNATVSSFTKEGTGVKDAVVVLKNPKLEGDRLTFEVEVLEGDLSGADGSAAVFIDLIGRPFTPLSFAGARRRAYRRMAYRGAYYRGAALGAAAAAARYYYRRRPCGYYPYPPCY